MADFDLSNFLASFFDEARERLNSINQGLVAFEAGSLDAEGLVTLRRDAHTIKGSALMLGVPDIGGAAHLFEDVMEQLIENPSWRTPAMTQFLYDLHDVLELRLQDPDAQENNIDIAPLRVKHGALLAAVKSGLSPDITTTAIEKKDEVSASFDALPLANSKPDKQQPAVVEVDLTQDLPALDTWVQDDALTVDLNLLTDANAVTEKDASSVDMPNFSGLIGADEADSWKAERAKKRGLDEGSSHQPQLGLSDLSETRDAFDAFVLSDATDDVVQAELSPLLQDGTTIEIESTGLVDGEPVETEFTDLVGDESVEVKFTDLVGDESVEVKSAGLVDSEPVEVEYTDLVEDESAELMLENLIEEEFPRNTPNELLEESTIKLEPMHSLAEGTFDFGAETFIEETLVDTAADNLFEDKSAEAMLENRIEEEKETEKETVQAMPANLLAKEENKAESISLEPLPTQDVSLTTYRPDMAQIEMKTTAQRKSSGRFLRVDAERLENLSNQVIELSTDQSRGHTFESVLQELAAELRGLQREWRYFAKSFSDFDDNKRESTMLSLERGFESQIRKHRRLNEELSVSQQRGGLMYRDLRDQVLSLMLRPLDSVFSTFPRAVRDVAIRLHKRARLVIGGKTLEMDQGVAESLVEPLVHLLNNAVAHGIELPAVRRALGKPEEGQISVIARQNGSEVRIEVIDDGQGLDVERIKEVAVERGVTTQIEANNMDSAEILEMIFRPGFTTKREVDATSGRGIGMNVVQDTIRRLTGSIRIYTEVGLGTRFVLSLPVSIAVQHALMFRMGTMLFGMLTHMVEQAIPLHKQDIQIGAGGKKFIMYGKQQVPVVDMRRMLSGANNTEGLSKNPNVLIAEHIEGYVGIVVDELIDDIEIVVRNLDPYIKRYQPQGLMGNTIADDGSVVMLLEPYGIKEMGRTAPDDDIEIDVHEDEKLHLRILLVDDSLIARAVEKSIFESIGFTVDTAIDGLDGLEKLKIQSYDMIVTDLEMPRLDGFGFVRRIRNQSAYEDLPIIIISTRESAEDRMRAMESGADTYMVKQHLNGDEILKTVQTLLGSVDTS